MSDIKLKNRELTFGKVFTISSFILLFFLIGGPLHSYTFLSFIPHEIYSITIWGNIWKLIWAGLAFVFMFYYKNELPISIKEMFTKINIKYVSIYLLIFTLINFILMLLPFKKLSIPDVSTFFGALITYFFVGLTEETVFRGWMLNALLKVTSFWKANIIQSIFFMLVHLLPYFVVLAMGGEITNNMLIDLALQLPHCIVFSCITGWMVKTSRSLWTTIVIHWLSDVLVIVFFPF